jgi:sulfur-carrier protein adenylyltransferase/sulfurtransferase
VVGAGGLGCPVLQYLTAAGVGTIGIVDDDRVDASNLQRQVLYATDEVGQYKADVAARKLRAQNPFIRLKPYLTRLTKDNALEIMRDYDLVVDGTDNFATRYLINDACVLLNKPLVYGAIYKFEGQVSVFNYTAPDGTAGPTYRCLFPDPPAAGSVPNCAEIGVLGILPGIIGTYQANEVIKVITGIGKTLSGELLMIDLLTMTTRKMKVRRTFDTSQLTELGDYEEVCAVPEADLKELTPEELAGKLSRGEDIQLIDVREPYEFDICRIENAQLIPMNSIQRNLHKISRDKPVVFICHHGMRSAQVLEYVKRQTGLTKLYNLTGGIHAWAEEVDPEMEMY